MVTPRTVGCIPRNLLVLLMLVVRVEGRARLIEPTMRSSLWRLGEINVPVNFMDELLNCGGFREQWQNAAGKCGACGDSYLSSAKQNEYPGFFSKQSPIKTIHQSEKLNVTVYSKANLLGYFEFRLCPHQDGPSGSNLEECFKSQPLLVIDEINSTRYYTGNGREYFDMHLRMPDGLTCDVCVLQWKYHTGYRTGCDFPGCHKCLGCGPQEEYINCADIRILDKHSAHEHVHEHTQLHPRISFTSAHPNNDAILGGVDMTLSHNGRNNENSDNGSDNEHAYDAHVHFVYAHPPIDHRFLPNHEYSHIHEHVHHTPYQRHTHIHIHTPETRPYTFQPVTSFIYATINPLQKASPTRMPLAATTAPLPTTFPSTILPCNENHTNIICGPIKSQENTKGRFGYCSIYCYPGRCEDGFCSCWCQNNGGSSIPFPDKVVMRPRPLPIKRACYVGNYAWRLVPGIGKWCQLNCPGTECVDICELGICIDHSQ